jgi:hypothetical protein
MRNDMQINSIRWWMGLLASVLMLASLGAAAQTPWTWNNATHPAGAGGVPGGTSGAGVWVYRGIYYIPGVGHMDGPLGDWRVESTTGTGTFGRVSHTTRPTQTETGDDIGLIATGTKPLTPRIRVSDAWQDAPISDIAHGEFRKGANVCHSGHSVTTQLSNGYRCGTLTMDCTRTSVLCYLAASSGGIVSGGDSGGPVWWYDGKGGIVLMGWIRGSMTVNGTQWGMFTPVWILQDHAWKPEETWESWGYPTGNDGTGCFLTTRGCVRS